LSRLGRQILAFCGAAINLRTGDRDRDAKIMTYDEEQKSIILSGKAVIAFDNYNYAFGSATLKLNRRVDRINMNVTVCGISVMKADVKQSFKVVDGTVYHSVPKSREDLLELVGPLSDRLSRVSKNLEAQTDSPFSYFEIARCVEEEIGTVPLTSEESKVTDEPEHMQFNLDSYHPIFVSNRDTVENVGMAHLMSRIFNMVVDVIGERKYVYVRMDVAVFNKWLRVRICSSNLMANVTFVVSLG
jgi:hypothetical protein